MTLLLVVVALVIVAGVSLLVARDRPLIADDPVGPPPFAWPPEGEVVAGDLDDVRFAVALRGYRMDEVDRVLADAASALAARDRRIAELERRARAVPADRPDVLGGGPPAGASPSLPGAEVS